METIKARKQGNAIMLTVPKSFNVKEGTKVKPTLTTNGIYYEFVRDDDFFDFDEDILKDLIEQGFEGKDLINKFHEIKRKMPLAMNKLVEEAKRGPILSKEEALKEIGLSDSNKQKSFKISEEIKR